MNKSFCQWFLTAGVVLVLAAASHAAMTVQSLSGAVTATEISSYKTFMQGRSAPTANTYDNNMADGTAGTDSESLGRMYEVSHDTQILDMMIKYADAFLSLRNDFTDQRVMWTGKVEPVWLTKSSSDSAAGYSGCESGEIAGHIAYCAKLILQTPSIWNTTVAVGDPHHYGATYYQRAIKYIAELEYSEDNYFTKWFIDSTTHRIKDRTVVDSRFSAFGQSTTAWNRQMMFINAWQRLSECHAILQDNPGKLSSYDAIVQASISWFQSEWQTTTAGGQTCYVWQYAPGHSGGNEEMNGHAAFDMCGVTRAFTAGKYGLTQSNMRPFAEALRYVIYRGNNTFAEWVNGDTSSTRNYIYGQWMPVAGFDPQIFATMANADIAQGVQGSNPIYDAMILWVKNARALGIFPANTDTADFSLVTPWVENITSGNSANYPVSVNALAGFGSGVTLSMSGLPSGVTASFTAGNNSTLTISASASVVGGVYAATISGAGGGLTRTAPITLVVSNTPAPNFTLSTTPSSRTIAVGSSTTYTVSIAAVNGFSGSVGFSVSGLPTGASASFSPTTVTGSGSSTVTVTGGSSTPAGTYTLTITGTSGSLTHSATVTLVVTDFTISATPSSQTVTAGNGTSYTVNVGSVNGFSSSVGLTIGGLPSGATGSFNPTSVTPAGSSTLTVTTGSSTPAGTYTLTITGTSGSLTHSATVTLVVNAAPSPDFSISASPSSQTVTAGNGTSYTATVGAINGFSGNVSLSVSGLPAGAGGSFSPASITTSGSSTLTVTTSASTPAGTYTLTVTGTSGSLVHSGTVTLVVNPASVTWTTVNDADAGVTFNASWSYSANRNLGDYNNDVHYTKTNGNYAQFTFTGTGVQYITEANTDEGNVDVYIDNVFQATVNCNAASRQAQFVAYSNAGLSAGTHTIKVVKNGGTYMLFDAFAYVAGGAPSPDFSLSASPSSQTVTAGSGTTYTATISALNGFSGSVNLSVSGLPSGATGSFSPASITTSGSSTLTVSTSASTPAGTYTLTITGTSGSLTHTATVSLTVNSQMADSNIAPNGTGYGWSAMTASTANTGKVAQSGLNDNNLTANVDLLPAGDAVGAWEAAGVTWSSAKSISSVDFINGDINTGGDGFLTANLKLQFTTDGTTWTDSGWTVSPAYPYSTAAGGHTYTFSGAAVSGKLGARVIGQVRTTDTSYHWIVKEVQIIGH